VIALTSGDKYASLIEVPTEGGEERLLTNERWAWIFALAWLRDGRGLIVGAGQSYTQTHLVYVSYPDGRVRTLTNDLNNYADISLTDDGRSLLTLESQELTNAWVGSLTDPDSAKQITSGNAGLLPSFAWTPDDKIVYRQQSGAERGSSMWVMAPDGTGARPLITSSTATYSWPRASPDGRYLVFVASSHTESYSHIWRMDSDGSNAKQLTNSASDNDEYPDTSLDGKWVLYGRCCAEKGIWKVPIEGGDPVRLNDREATSPSVSPDGKMIAYLYHDPAATPVDGVEIMTSEGGPPMRRLDASISSFTVCWTADGRFLLYSKDKGGVSNIWSEPIAGRPAKQISHYNRDVMFRFDLSRDGKRLLMERGTHNQDLLLIRDVR
jgi:dipeptidyl aminopeptidase/acylaminoacyl peptidase